MSRTEDRAGAVNSAGPSLASLPMYDLPELREATDAWWQGLASAMRDVGIDAPDGLTRGPDAISAWSDPRLLLSQTCGYPLVYGLGETVRVIGTPSYAAPGCDEGRYRSVVVVRDGSRVRVLEDLRGGVCAINSFYSHSGHNALRHLIAPLAAGSSFFSDIRLTGSHRASARAVLFGEADVAAIDAVTLALLQRHAAPEFAGLTVLTWTEAAPGLPLVTAAARDHAQAAQVAVAVGAAFAAPALAEVRSILMIDGFVPAGDLDYNEIRIMEDAAIRQGYPAVA